MTKIKFIAVFLIFFSLVIVSCNNNALDNNPSTQKIDLPPDDGGDGDYGDGSDCIVFWNKLIAGQSIVVGDVIGKYDDETGILSITYNTTDGWIITEVHFEIEKYKEDMPLTKKGNPQVGKFLIGEEDLSGDSYTLTIDMNDTDLFVNTINPGDVFYAAAHAKVEKTVDNYTQEETAWANGTRFVDDKGNWAMYFTYNFGCNEINEAQ
jgi:hypothetical protein